jgi:hypothetical protein
MQQQQQHKQPPQQRQLLQEYTAAAARLQSKMAVVACARAVYPHYNTNSKFPADATTQRTTRSTRARDVASVRAEQVQVVRAKLQAGVQEGAARIDSIARIAARLEHSGRQAHASAADADSQFDSVARLVAYAALLEHPLSPQTPAAVQTLRNEVSGWLQAHRAELTSGLNRQNGLAAAPGHKDSDVTELEGKAYTQWCHRFRNRGCWGDQYSLQALAEVLDLDIHVWSTRGELYDLSVTPGCSTTAAGRTDCHPRGGSSSSARHRVRIELLELPGGVYSPVVNTHATHLQ